MNEITIYGMPNCKWCDQARALAQMLTDFEVIDQYTYVDTSKFPNGASGWLTDHGFKETKVRTLPKVYHNGVLLGGFTEFDKKFSS